MSENSKPTIGEDKEGKPIEADAYYCETAKDGSVKKYPAKIVKREIVDVKIWVSDTVQRKIQQELVDLRVAFGGIVMRANAAGVLTSQPEYKPVFGVAKRGQSYNPTGGKYWEPILPTEAELAEMSDGEKNADALLAELRILRSKVKQAPSNEFAIMSDKDLQAHARSIGVKLKQDATRAEIIKAIEDQEK